MYSGVAGMRTHQTRMDVIGNNISNVNTYGFKSSRATFRDVYYQATKNASAATVTRGGVNPAMVGYGAQIASIDVLQTQSSLSNTGNPLDVAIMGDGFFQVQDTDGNIFYTKAGMLDIDSMGNLVDLNGNFVLGVSGNPLGKDAASNRIQISVPAVTPAAPSFSETIDGVQVTITGSNNTEDGNVVFNFIPASDLPVGQKVDAVLSSSGVTIRVNPKSPFTNMADFEKEVNSAITRANNGAEHPAGQFSIQISPSTKFANGLTGEEIVGYNFGIKLGTVEVPSGLWGGAKFDSVGDQFHPDMATATEIKYSVDHKWATDVTPESLQFTIKIGGTEYVSEKIEGDALSQLDVARKMLFTNKNLTDSADSITLTMPSYNSIIDNIYDLSGKNSNKFTDNLGDIRPHGYKKGDRGPDPAQLDPATQMVNKEASVALDNGANDDGSKLKASADSLDLGLGSKPLLLDGGTVGGPQTVKDLTGIAIGTDGVITGSHPVHGQLELGRIDLATFENMQGLEQSGNTYFTVSKNSGPATVVKAGTHGTGALKSNSLEMSNVDLSQEFSDMITTQRGFQANSRIITVSDTMLEELINLKR